MAPSAIRPMEPQQSLRALVGEALSSEIISGELAPGTLLTVPTLAAQFDVSATPVREAMLDLEGRGFVEPVRNKGFRVTEVSDETLRDLVEVRQLLEPPAMEELARRFPHDELPAFETLAAAIVEGARSGDLRVYLEADVRFHLGLTRLLGNRLLVDTIADLRSRTRLVGLSAMLETKHLSESAAEHHVLLQHLADGDAAAAGELMRRHISHTLGWWSGRPEGEPASVPE
ncbi:GntR family transcriptional regulator [Agromyces archimandritae]|uniref:GntR family transcriptional regulator n=1 Tax=Agromyces archimandritae TaxID=2781962 RepID=A0A975FNQ2_9MICO|nr:GntR family transcriptional regulator [Agromyces archimandritae]QTX05545.1 GntR family transcriptional regulator [Agromyces archimandritae]